MKFSACFFIVFQVVYRVSGQGVSGQCTDAMNACGGTMYAEIDAAIDNDSICAAVDKALGCVATETASCDLLAKADISTGMADIISIYLRSPYNCTLPNQNNAAFNDPCFDQLSYCVNIYYESEYTPTTTEACQGFDRYMNCMETNTTSCTDTAARTTITEATNNATTKMNADPYYCNERDSYNIAACENGFYACVDPLSAIGTAGTDTSSVVCSEIDTFSQCVQTNNANCSPRLASEYTENASNLTITFQGDPYYCGAANPCLEAFKGCNNSENSIQPATGCGLLAVYDACMSSVSVICDADKLTITATEVDNLKQQLETDLGCSTTPTTTITAQTTSPTVTTSSQSNTPTGETVPTTVTTPAGQTASTTVTAITQGATATQQTGQTSTAATITSTQPTGSHNTGNFNQDSSSTPSWTQFYGGDATKATVSLLTTAAMLLTSLFLS